MSTPRSGTSTWKGRGDQCGSPGGHTPTEHGWLCDGCAFRQAMHNQQREAFSHLSPSTFGFDPYDDDPYD